MTPRTCCAKSDASGGWCPSQALGFGRLAAMQHAPSMGERVSWDCLAAHRTRVQGEGVQHVYGPPMCSNKSVGSLVRRVKNIQDEYQKYMERVRAKAQSAIDQANTAYSQQRNVLMGRFDALVAFLTHHQQAVQQVSAGFMLSLASQQWQSRALHVGATRVSF